MPEVVIERIPTGRTSLPRVTPRAGSTYVAARNGEVVTAPCLTAMLARVGGAPIKLPALAQLCTTRMPLIGETIYEGIHALPALCEPTVMDGGLRFLSQRHDVAEQVVEPDFAARELRRQIEASVVRAVGSSRRIALSIGGLDSSAIASVLAAMRDDGRLEHVTLLTLHGAAGADDRAYVDELASYLRLPLKRIFPEDGARWMRSTLVLDSAPHPFAQAGTDLALHLAAKELGAERILAGNGGDRLFDGDVAAWPAEFRRHPLRVGARALQFRMMQDASRYQRWRRLVGRPLLESMLPPSSIKRWRGWRGVRAIPEWAGPVLAQRLEEPISPPVVPMNATERFHVLATAPEAWASGFIRTQSESISGMTRYDVYLDAELMEFIASLPPDMLILGNRARGLFRRAFSGRLPESILERHTKSDFEPLVQATFDAAGGYAAFDDLADARELGRMGIVDRGRFREAWQRARASAQPYAWMPLYRVLAVEAFARATS